MFRTAMVKGRSRALTGYQPPSIVVTAAAERSPLSSASTCNSTQPPFVSDGPKLKLVGKPAAFVALRSAVPPASSAACTFCTSSGNDPVGYTTRTGRGAALDVLDKVRL